MSVSNERELLTPTSIAASVPNAADSGQLYQPICAHCDERGEYTLATEKRWDDDLCASCATSYDEACYEASLSEYYGGGGCQSDWERFDVDSMNRVRR